MKKHSSIKRALACLFAAAALVSAPPPADAENSASAPQAPESPPAAKASAEASPEKEYLGGVVLLVDYETGDLGVSFPGEDGKASEKMSFKVDLPRAEITNPLNQYLEFDHIQIGDNIDLVTLPSENGEGEVVVEILDYDRYS